MNCSTVYLNVEGYHLFAKRLPQISYQLVTSVQAESRDSAGTVIGAYIREPTEKASEA
jgi:hypothetical protein